ncbi:MAG: hypothetical protein ACI861_002434 [Paracoccaceae bacterium]|jgi:hypothetical protein
MPKVSHSAFDMISEMTPTFRPGVFVFVTTIDASISEALVTEAISVFREDEGMSMIIPVELAEKHALEMEHPMRCITLNVYSSLEGVGLTSAVSAALDANGIPCNMVAAFHHDHVFVPLDVSERAMQVLVNLQTKAVES